MAGIDDATKATMQKLPLCTIKAGPRDGEDWIKRVKEEYKALIQYQQVNKEAGNEWFTIEAANKTGTRWQGKVWTFHDSIKYEFDLEFDIPVSYPSVAPELALPELDGKTEKMYRGGKARAAATATAAAAAARAPRCPRARLTATATRADLPRLALPAAVGAQRAALRHRARDGAGHGPVARGGDPVARRAGADQAGGRKIMKLP